MTIKQFQVNRHNDIEDHVRAYNCSRNSLPLNRTCVVLTTACKPSHPSSAVTAHNNYLNVITPSFIYTVTSYSTDKILTPPFNLYQIPILIILSLKLLYSIIILYVLLRYYAISLMSTLSNFSISLISFIEHPALLLHNLIL
jgi:hypothetical protein